MPALRRTLIFLTAVLWLAPAGAAEAIRVNVDEQNPPFMSARDGRASGIYPALLRAAFARIGRPLVLEAKPWTRALLELDEAKAGIGGIYINSQRAQKYDFSTALLVENTFVYFNTAKPITFRTLADLKGKRIGVIRGWSYGDAFDAARRNGDFIVEEVVTDASNFRKLARGRLDAVVAIEEAGRQVIAAQRLNNIARSRGVVASNSAHLAFNKASAQTVLLSEFDRTIAAMKRDGTFNRIVREELAH